MPAILGAAPHFGIGVSTLLTRLGKLASEPATRRA